MFEYELTGLSKEKYENLKFRLSDVSKHEGLLEFNGIEVNQDLFNVTMLFSVKQEEFEHYRH